jgi:hypothetical protein
MWSVIAVPDHLDHAKDAASDRISDDVRWLSERVVLPGFRSA